MARKHDTSGHRRTQRKRLENRTAGTPITPDNLLTNSATVSDESPQESYHKNSEKPLVFDLFWESAICWIAEGRIWQDSRQPDNLQTNSATVSDEVIVGIREDVERGWRAFLPTDWE